jgi:flagellar protein FlaF
VRDDWDNELNELGPALAFNRKLWTVFLGSVTGDDSQLPKTLRESIANLGLFVMKHTMAVQAEPAASKLTVLININRELSAGLRAQS